MRWRAASKKRSEPEFRASSNGEMSSAQSRCVMGIDVGGTKIAAGLLALPEGDASSRRIIPTDAAGGGQHVLKKVLQLARDLADEATTLGHSLEAIGLGICELVDREGHLASANCIPWLDQPVREVLSDLAPTIIEADVRAAALAEALFGAGEPFRNFLYVTIGTGISCCLMLDGDAYLGAHGAAGTMASSPLTIPCQQCGHVSARTLEEISAGPALVRQFNAAGGKAASGQEVLAAAAGNSLAKQIVDTAAEVLGSQIGLFVNTLDPEALVIGGGLGLSEGPYWEHFVVSTRRHIWSIPHRQLPILRAAAGVDAGWIGAAAKAAHHFAREFKPANKS
jgi:glucokinase